MILRGIKFPPVQAASGVLNFFGEGYWFHRFFRIFFKMRLKGAEFVSKTSTLLPRTGNLPLKNDGVTPKEMFPQCIIVNQKKGFALNAVSLSGPGLEFLLSSRRWQSRTEPFSISIMSLAKTESERIDETKEMFRMINHRRKEFRSAFCVQANKSCPNGGLDRATLVEETLPMLDMAEECLDPQIPLVIKLGPDAHPLSAAKIASHTRCDGLSILNTLPFGTNPKWMSPSQFVLWEKLFGTSDPKKSPLSLRFPGFPGGLSGEPIFPLLLEWLRQARAAGIRKHIVAGGGILSSDSVDLVKNIGADSVSICSIVFLKPWKVTSSIRRARQIFS